MIAATHAQTWKVATGVSLAQNWGTPPSIYHALDQEFDFTLDAAADTGNAKHVRFFTKDTDALGADWSGERVFCNPPYGRGMGRWVAKAFHESSERGALVVMLLPARTDVAWFHDVVMPHAEVRFIRGRLGFTLGGGSRRARAPFASMVVVFRPFAKGQGNAAEQHLFAFMPRAIGGAP